MMTRTLLPVMEAAVTMSQMSQSGLDEETRAERKCREETVMVTAVEKSGARRKEVRKLAERELRAVMKMTVTTKNPRRRGSLEEEEEDTMLQSSYPQTWQTLWEEVWRRRRRIQCSSQTIRRPGRHCGRRRDAKTRGCKENVGLHQRK